MTQSQERFQRGYIAMSYLLGRRGSALADGLGHGLDREQALTEALSAKEKRARAQALGAELANLLVGMSDRRLQWP